MSESSLLEAIDFPIPVDDLPAAASVPASITEPAAPVSAIPPAKPKRPPTMTAALADWVRMKKLAHVDRTYLAGAKQSVRQFLQINEIDRFQDVRPEQIATFFAARLEQKAYARSYLKAQVRGIASFLRWASARYGFDYPLEKLRLRSIDGGVRGKIRVRRILLVEEWHVLREMTLQQGVDRVNLTAEERVLLYATVLQTGFRSVECSRLRCLDLHAGTDRPYLHLTGHGRGRTKNFREARQHVQPSLAQRLGLMIQRRFSGRKLRLEQPLFDAYRTSWPVMAQTLAEDIAAARTRWGRLGHAAELEAKPDFLAVQDSSGRVLDFHALRYTCGAWLVHLNTNIQVVKTIMRHSTIQLTYDAYGALYPNSDFEAVQKSPATV